MKFSRSDMETACAAQAKWLSDADSLHRSQLEWVAEAIATARAEGRREALEDAIADPSDWPFPYEAANTSGPLSVRLVNTMLRCMELQGGRGWGSKENVALKAVEDDLRAAAAARIRALADKEDR